MLNARNINSKGQTYTKLLCLQQRGSRLLKHRFVELASCQDALLGSGLDMQLHQPQLENVQA